MAYYKGTKPSLVNNIDVPVLTVRRI